MTFPMLHYFSVALYYMRLSIRRQLEYPLFLVSWLLATPLQYLSGIWMIKVIIQQFHPLAGWSFLELAYLYGLGLLSHGVMVVVFHQSWSIDRMVINGEYDRLLLRPLNVFFQKFVSNINFIGLIDLIPAVIIFVYASMKLHLQFNLFQFIQLISVIFGGALIQTSVFILIGTISFWTRRSGSMVWPVLELLERSTMYPLSLFPSIIQKIFTYVVPIGFISYYPAISLLGKRKLGWMGIDVTFWVIVIGVGMFYLAQRIFRWGLVRYESTGA